jgi:N-hydroxyarylamine O-acetyltransferase
MASSQNLGGEHVLDLAAYFARIAYAGPQEASLDALRALQSAHIAAIPFEAIDVLLGDGVSLDPRAIDDKLVHRGRGGYCYEQNGLFSRVLERLGFAVEPRIARVLWGGAGDSQFQPRTHMALLVEAAGERRLVDVGFGSAVPTEPLRWHGDAEQDTVLGRYRLVATRFGRRLEIQAGGVWRPLYEVFHEPPQREDFEVANWFTATHPDSPFRRNLIVARATAEGRIILSGSELTFRSPRGEARRERLDAERLEAALQNLFKLPVEPRWRTELAQWASRQ